MSYYINFKYYIYFESTYSYLLQIKIFIDKSIVHITMITYIFKFCELNYLIHVIVLVYKNYLLWIIKTKKYICMIELWKSAFLCEQLKFLKIFVGFLYHQVPFRLFGKMKTDLRKPILKANQYVAIWITCLCLFQYTHWSLNQQPSFSITVKFFTLAFFLCMFLTVW